jgi:transcriptional regulator with XRE-family HTH domain
MKDATELGRFLTSRRAQLQPADVGLREYGERRRVPGLRREELAQLAGVSQAYYTRLEQGISQGASPEVLDAIARALGLDEIERNHLHDLAAADRKGGSAGRAAAAGAGAKAAKNGTQQLTDAARQLIAAFGRTPVVVLGRRSDVLGWNRTGHAFFAGHLDFEAPERAGQPEYAQQRPNTARLVFRDPHTRELYGEDWPRKARDAVGRLRLAAGKHPEDAALEALIGELAVHSTEFAELWAEHPVRAWDVARYRMHHPAVGTLDVTQQAMIVPAMRGARLVAVTAPEGSSSAAALALLAHSID